jgi:hypothetical protein
MAFSFGYPLWLGALSLLLAGGLTYWSYRRTIPSLPAGWRWALGTLRFVSLALICFLLLRPILRTVSETDQPPVLAVLVDDTQSMRVTQGADTTADAVRQTLAPLLSSLEEDLPGTARVFGFDAALRALPSGAVDSLRFSGRRSDVGAALQSVTESLQGENLRAVALVSDGQYNSGRNPARVADRLGVPVHTVTVGDTTRRRDLQVRRVVTNDLSYVDTEVPVRVTLQATDVGPARTTVALLGAGGALDTAQVSLPAGTAERTLDLSFRPETPGLKQLTVRAAPVGEEATLENNRRTVSLRVLDNKRQALVLGAAPSPSFSALRRVLARDANTSVTARVPKQDGTFYGGPLPDTLDRYDVVVCAGFPGPTVPEAAVRRVAALVEDGMPVVFALDRRTNRGAWTTHFADALPAQPPGAAPAWASASFAPVDAQRAHPVFQIEGADVGRFRRLPPVDVPATAWSPSPDAQVLAEAVRPSLSRRDPALVVRRRAGRRSALLLATGTWRWATLPQALEAADPLWPGLVTNLVRWVSTDTDDRQVRVRPVASTFRGDEPVEFTGQVYDESNTPVSRATVSVTVTDSTGTADAHTMEPIGEGRYTLSVGALPPGPYRYEASATRDDARIGTDRGQFTVGRLRLEYRQPRADPVLMRRIAARSGGRAYVGPAGTRLASALGRDSTFAPTVSVESQEAELWRTSVFLAVILLLLAAEWALRKRFGLS